jgi:ABC-type oligopeptide transport system ATPase subunit
LIFIVSERVSESTDSWADAVMYLGKIVELGTGQALFSSPLHFYIHILLSSVPVPGKKSHPELLQRAPPFPATGVSV